MRGVAVGLYQKGLGLHAHAQAHVLKDGNVRHIVRAAGGLGIHHGRGSLASLVELGAEHRLQVALGHDCSPVEKRQRLCRDAARLATYFVRDRPYYPTHDPLGHLVPRGRVGPRRASLACDGPDASRQDRAAHAAIATAPLLGLVRRCLLLVIDGVFVVVHPTGNRSGSLVQELVPALVVGVLLVVLVWLLRAVSGYVT